MPTERQSGRFLSYETRLPALELHRGHLHTTPPRKNRAHQPVGWIMQKLVMMRVLQLQLLS